MNTLVLDNTPLSHFARAGALAVLESITMDFRRIVPAEVVQELLHGIANYPMLATAVSLPWIEVVELTDAGPACTAGPWSSTRRAGTRAARRDHIEVHGSLWLIANAIRSGKLPKADAVNMVDQLAATDMALPVDGARFVAWAYEEGLLP